MGLSTIQAAANDVGDIPDFASEAGVSGAENATPNQEAESIVEPAADPELETGKSSVILDPVDLREAAANDLISKSEAEARKKEEEDEQRRNAGGGGGFGLFSSLMSKSKGMLAGAAI